MSPMQMDISNSSLMSTTSSQKSYDLKKTCDGGEEIAKEGHKTRYISWLFHEQDKFVTRTQRGKKKKSIF